MPFFKYKARDRSGILISGTIEGADKAQVSDDLNKLKYFIISIDDLQGFHKTFQNFIFWLKTKKKADFLTVMRQMSSMVKAGLPLLTVLRNITQQTYHPALRKALEQIANDVEAGSTLAKSVEKHPKYFSSFAISMINVGEISGRLDDVLDRLVFIGKKEREIRSKIINALLYPFILLLLSFSLVIFLLVGVMPKFIAVYRSLNADLPLLTKFMLNLSEFLKFWWWIFPLILMAAIYLLKNYRKNHQGKYNSDNILLKLPLIGSLILKYNIARFSRTLGSLIKSGINLIQAINVTETTVDNYVLKTFLKDLNLSVLEGNSISDQINISAIFPPMVLQMVNAGEKTGRLDEMLLDIAEFYDTEVDTAIKSMTTIIEPLLLILMGGMVGFMALAVLKPVLNLAKIVR